MATTVFPDGGMPNGNEIRNAPGTLAPLVSPLSITPEVTSLLYQQMYDTFFRTRPQSDFDSLQVLLFDKAPRFFDDDEFSWWEMPDQRVPLVVDDGSSPAGDILTAAQVGAPGVSQTATIPCTAAMQNRVGLNTTLHFRGGGWATVTAKPTPTTLTVTSPTNLGLPAIIQGQRITIGAEVRADGMTRIVNTTRAQGLKRTNFITTIMKARSYGRKEWFKMNQAASTNFMTVEEQEIILEAKFEALTELWNGVKNFHILDDGSPAKGTDGVHTQLINGGVVPIPTNIGGMVPVFESLSHSTNFKSGTTYVIATEMLLYELSKAYKELKVRYEPNSKVADLNLDAIKIGSRTHVLVPANVFSKAGYFPGWDGKMFMLDKESIHMAGMKSMPFMDINNTMGNHLLSLTDQPHGSRIDNFTHKVEMTFAPMVVNPQGCAIIDVAVG